LTVRVHDSGADGPPVEHDDRLPEPPGERPLVSVIMIFLDEERFIAQAIESVLAQSYQDWELLLVDDGSMDRSTGIARDYCTRHPARIRYLEHPGHARHGTAASRNLGLAAARGEYVAFLDADDLYLPSRIESHVQVLRRWPEVAAVQSDHVRWHAWRCASGQGALVLHRFRPSLGDSVLRPPMALALIQAVPYLLPGTCDITVRRSVAMAVGGFEEQFRILYEDQSFVCKIYLEHAVYVRHAVEAVYRRHEGSSTMQSTAGRVVGLRVEEAERAFRKWLTDYVRRRVPAERAWLGLSEEAAGNESALGVAMRASLRRLGRRCRILALKAGGVRSYRWLVVQEYRQTMRRARLQYDRFCERLADRLTVAVRSRT
jgi:glycosyltransferase involved in cell wall biosynthesis